MSDALAHARHNLAIIGATRGRMVDLLQQYSLEQVNAVPAGFNNNLIWNAAHCYASMHRVLFLQNGASEPEMGVMGYREPTPEVMAGYVKGTRPTGDVDQAFVDETCAILSDQAWFGRVFKEFLIPERYTTWTTMWGVELTDAGQALSYLNMHEGMHYGVMLSLRKLL